MKLDEKDIEILKLLQADGRLTTAEIAERVNLSQSPCWRRINQFEQEGLVQKKVHLLNRDALGIEMLVFTSINLSTNSRESLEQFEQEIIKFPEVVECHTMTGSIDYMLKIITKSLRHFETFVRNQLTQLPNIREIHSNISVTAIKVTTELPLDTQLEPRATT